MSGFCLAATVGHAGLLPWLASVYTSDGMYTTLPISTTVAKEQRNGRAELLFGSRPCCGGIWLIQLQVRETTPCGISGARL
jgi:hypothetical protein